MKRIIKTIIKNNRHIDEEEITCFLLLLMRF